MDRDNRPVGRQEHAPPETDPLKNGSGLGLGGP